MKLIYAKLWLKKYIRYNHNKFDRKKLKSNIYGNIVSLSHRVYKGHGIHGHNIRQKIRKQLLEYSIIELRRYPITYKPSIFERIIGYVKRMLGK